MPRRRTVPVEIVDGPMPGLENIEQDPTPARRSRAAAKTAPKKAAGRAPGRPTNKQQLKDKVMTELYAVASMAVGLWGMRDPCADVMLEQVPVLGGQTVERLEEICRRTVELLARNERVLEAFATAGFLGEATMLGTLLIPIAKRVYSAHGPGGHGHKGDEVEVDYGRYPAPALA